VNILIPTDDVVFSILFGGSGKDVITSVEVDPSGDYIYISGSTSSPDLPLQLNNNSGMEDAFLAKLSGSD
jgi:hypothetical protein